MCRWDWRSRLGPAACRLESALPLDPPNVPREPMVLSDVQYQASMCMRINYLQVYTI
jgi:hypothetical protein